MTDRELLEFIAAKVGVLTTQMDSLTTQVNTVTADVSELKESQTRTEKVVLKIENEHGQKLDALFDGYKQNADSIERLENKVDTMSYRLDNQEIKVNVLRSVK